MATDTMTARGLPAAEWDEKLKGTELEGMPLDPEHSLVVVVEEDGRVVGCWAALTVVHVEGLWQAPDRRGHAGVSRALVSAMTQALLQAGIPEVLTQSVTPEIDALIEHAGGRRVPGTSWVLPLKGA